MSETALLLIIPLIFIPLFAAFWCGVVFLVAVISGWRDLAKSYAVGRDAFLGPTWTWQSGRMRIGARYKNVLTVGADPRGLYLATMILFRVGHPALLIPWQDIDVFDGRTFVFRRTSGVQLRVSATLGEQIARASGRAA